MSRITTPWLGRPHALPASLALGARPRSSAKASNAMITRSRDQIAFSRRWRRAQAAHRPGALARPFDPSVSPPQSPQLPPLRRLRARASAPSGSRTRSLA